MKKLKLMLFLILCMLFLTACNKNSIEVTVEPFPEFESTDCNGNVFTNELFENYDATIVNFWTNGCGSCIAEMPELEEYYQEFKEKNINLIGVACSANESDEEYILAKEILKEKGALLSN